MDSLVSRITVYFAAVIVAIAAWLLLAQVVPAYALIIFIVVIVIALAVTAYQDGWVSDKRG